MRGVEIIILVKVVLYIVPCTLYIIPGINTFKYKKLLKCITVYRSKNAKKAQYLNVHAPEAKIIIESERKQNTADVCNCGGI